MFTQEIDQRLEATKIQVRDYSYDLLLIEIETRSLLKRIINKGLEVLLEDDLDNLEQLIEVTHDTLLEVDDANFPRRSFLLGDLEFYLDELKQKVSAIRYLVEINLNVIYENVETN